MYKTIFRNSSSFLFLHHFLYGSDKLGIMTGDVILWRIIYLNVWIEGGVEVSSPQVGDLVFFTYSHVEIITKVENETVYCAGGNNGGTGNYKTNYCAGERKLYATARLYLRPNYKNINVEPPTNLSIQSDKTTIAAGESILFSYTIENSNDSYIGIDKDGTRYASIPVSGTSGTVSYTFTEPGSYCVIVEGSNPYGYKFCDNGIWILVNEATTPTNLSIQSDKTTIVAGESISFFYTIENSNDSNIGIDKDGSRYTSIPVSGTSGTVSYTFTEPGTYCVIIEGSNPYGYKFCDKGIWILVNKAAPPTNLSIQSDKTTIAAGESISFSYTIENSNDSYIGIDKDGTRYASIPVSGTSGTVSYTFTEPGSYCVIVEGSNPYGYKFCDNGIWILVNEATTPTNLSIQSDKTTIVAGESISFFYTIENSNDSNIGIDKDGSRYASIPVSGTSGTISYTFTEPGVYCVIVEGSNPYGYRFCDKGIWISVTYAPGDLNQDGTLSLTDLIPLQQSLLRQTTLTADQAQLADYNGDGSINVLDLMLLKRALLAL